VVDEQSAVKWAIEAGFAAAQHREIGPVRSIHGVGTPSDPSDPTFQPLIQSASRDTVAGADQAPPPKQVGERFDEFNLGRPPA